MANPHPPALPSPGRRTPWCCWLVISLALLVVAAWLTGAEDVRPDAPDGFVEPVLRTATSSVAVGVIAVLGFVTLLYSLRRLLLLSLAHRPGAIRVADLGDATSGGEAPVSKLTLHLRGRLTTINLHSPSPQPGSAASVSFLDELQDAADKPHNLLYTVAGLLRTVRPSHAYTVEGLLVHRHDNSASCGVAIQVATQMGGLSPPETIWAENWETAVEDGAIYAAALILPHTRKCREAPWSSWEGRPMPSELLGAYLRARRYHAERRYDEALGAYYEALAIDPLNLELRLEVGQLQEQLALWLDALASYQQIVTLTPRRQRRLTLRALSPRGRALHNAHRRASIIARYRSAVLLGGADKLAQQWLDPALQPDEAQRTERERERDQLRDQIRPGLQQRYGRAIERARATDASNAPPEWSEVIAPRPVAEPAHELWLREYFQVAAADEAWRLLRGALFPATRLSDTGITRHYLRVVVLWAHLHRNRTRAAAQRTPIRTEPVRDWSRRSAAALPGLRTAIRPRPGPIERWPATEEYVRCELHRWPRRLERRLSVADRYNAGCVYAVPLLGHPGNTRFDAVCAIDGAPPPPAPESAFADEARKPAEPVVAEFAEAAFIGHSAEFARRRAWLISEDPTSPACARDRSSRASSASTCRPRGQPSRDRSTHTSSLSRHTSRIVRRCARALEAEWHARDRASRGGCDVHDVETWIRQERRAWHLAWRLSHDHRHWPTRLAVVREMERWTLTAGRTPVSLPYPDYADDPLSDPCDGMSFEQSARPVIGIHDTRLADLRQLLDERRVDVELERWRWALEQLDDAGSAPPASALANLCRGQAALWRALHNWFEDEPGNGWPAGEAATFETAIEQLAAPPAAA